MTTLPPSRFAGQPDSCRLSDVIDVAHPGGPSFTLANRVRRIVWIVAWTLLARWTPPPLHRWRCGLLRLFGARLGRGVHVYATAKVWNPASLEMGDFSALGPRVTCYNQGRIVIGRKVVVSQGAHLCASTHDVSDPRFRLLLRPISIGDDAWIAADAFVGPGVSIGEGAVLGARGAAFQNLDAWTIYTGNPARPFRARVVVQPVADDAAAPDGPLS